MTHRHEDDATTAAFARMFAALIEAKLREAASLARTAITLESEGLADRAFMTLLEAEPLIHDANAILNAASIMRRHQRSDLPFA